MFPRVLLLGVFLPGTAGSAVGKTQWLDFNSKPDYYCLRAFFVPHRLIARLGFLVEGKQSSALPKNAYDLELQVLEEDEFLAQMGAIIERDYYPDVPKLRMQVCVC